MIEMRGRGFSVREIARELGRRPNTVQRWLSRYDATGELNNAPRPGRPRCTTRDEDVRFCERAVQNPTFSVPRLLAECGTDRPAMGMTTARKRLREDGLRLRTAKHRDIGLSKPRVRESRLRWARDENRMWAGLFDRTVYVDESCFCTFDNTRRRVWARMGMRGRVTHWVRRSGRVSVSVFGGLVGSRLTSLVDLPKKCTSWQLAQALKDSGWWNEVRAELGEGEVRVQLDNAPIHTGPGMREFCMAEPEFGGAVVFQPPYSPDLNPIEHVWARMKRRLRERVFSSAASLRAAVREVGRRLHVTRSSCVRSRSRCRAGSTQSWRLTVGLRGTELRESGWRREQGGVLFS